MGDRLDWCQALDFSIEVQMKMTNLEYLKGITYRIMFNKVCRQ